MSKKEVVKDAEQKEEQNEFLEVMGFIFMLILTIALACGILLFIQNCLITFKSVKKIEETVDRIESPGTRIEFDEDYIRIRR